MLPTCLWERGSKRERERERELAFSRAGVHLIPFDTSVLFLQIASVVCSLQFHKESIFFFPSAVGDFHFTPNTWSARPVSQCYGTHECFVFRFLERVTYPIQFTAKSLRFNDSWRLRGLPSGSSCLISQNPVLKRQTMGSLFDSLFICEGLLSDVFGHQSLVFDLGPSLPHSFLTGPRELQGLGVQRLAARDAD